VQHVAEAGNAGGGEGLDGPAEMALTRMPFLPMSTARVADRGLERSLATPVTL
jgi:hypothetical protein